MQPAIDNRRGGGGFILPIAFHQHIPADENFTLRAEPGFNTANSGADGFDLDLRRPVCGNQRRGFGLAITLQNVDPKTEKECPDIGVERRPAGNEILQTATETPPYLAADQPVEQLVKDGLRQAQPCAVLFPAQPYRLMEQFFRQPALGLDPPGDAVIEHFIKPRNRRHQGGADLSQIIGDPVGTFAVIDLGLCLYRQMQPGRVFVGM